MVGAEYNADFARVSAAQFKFLEMKTKEIQLKERERSSMSRVIPWRSAGCCFEEIVATSAWQSDLIQILVMPMSRMLRRADLTARASAINGEDVLLKVPVPCFRKSSR